MISIDTRLASRVGLLYPTGGEGLLLKPVSLGSFRGLMNDVGPMILIRVLQWRHLVINVKDLRILLILACKCRLLVINS